MTPEEAQQIINVADMIRKKISDYKLYGKPIDTENVSHLLVAAYFLGIVEADVPKERKRETPGFNVL